MQTVFNPKIGDPRDQPLFLGESLGLQRFDRLRYPKFFKLAEQQEEFFWRASEVSLQKDRNDYRILSDNDRFIYDNNLRFQTCTDAFLSRSIDTISQYVSNPELEACFKVWSFFESNIHSRSYSHILKNVYPDETVFWNSILENSEIMERAKVILASYDDLFDDDKRDIKTKIFNCMVSTNVTEGLAFYVSFACSFFYGAQGKMEGNAKIIKLIERDEKCCDKETEIFTTNGWKYLKNVTLDDCVGQVNADGNLKFVKPLKVIAKPYSGKMIQFISKGHDINMVLTPDHRFVYRQNGLTKEIEASKFNKGDNKKLMVTAPYHHKRQELSSLERFHIAVQADGSIVNPELRNGKFTGCNVVSFKLTKARKKERLEKLLNDLKLEYTPTDLHDTERKYYIKVPLLFKATKNFSDWVTYTDKDQKWCKEFIEELVQWDGHINSDARYCYSSIIKSNVDIAQTIACMAGYRTHYSVEIDNQKETYSDVHRLSIRKNETVVDSQCMEISEIDYDDQVYCVSVPSGMFLARRRNCIFVTGNCHAAITSEVLKIFKNVPNEGFQDIYDEEKIKEAYRIGVKTEKDWADYLFQHGNLLGLTKEQFQLFAEYKANERLKILGIEAIFPKQSTNPLGNWYDEFVSPRKTQVAPQESELESYAIGARKTELDEKQLSSFAL